MLTRYDEGPISCSVGLCVIALDVLGLYPYSTTAFIEVTIFDEVNRPKLQSNFDELIVFGRRNKVFI